MYTDPSINDFKKYFARDFPFTSNSFDLTKVTDPDISKAMSETSATINQGLFTSQASYTTGYLLLAAHNMVMNLRASSQGISGQYAWLEASKSVGSVSQGFSIPNRILENPILAMYAKTNYGAKYILMILPLLSGNVFIVEGATLA